MRIPNDTRNASAIAPAERGGANHSYSQSPSSKQGGLFEHVFQTRQRWSGCGRC